MKRNQKILQDDEIDVGEIIKTLWNEKILILSISLFFMVIGYVYGALQTKVYKTEITIREVPTVLFAAHAPFSDENISSQFNKEFKLNFLSVDTLIQFVEKTNTMNDFKTYLKEKNINYRKYFQEKIKNKYDINKNEIPNNYTLTYSQPLPGENFLKEYTFFVQQQTLIMFKENLIKNILHEMSIYKHHLNIAETINLENFLLNERDMKNKSISLFYLGTKVLSQQIIYFNQLLKKSENLAFDYNPILEQPRPSVLVSKKPVFFMLMALAFALFLSFIVVYLRFIFQKKN